MECSRLNHFVKIETGSAPLFRCCHMVNPPRFNTLEELESSQWLDSIQNDFKKDQWPEECKRCQQTEDAGLESVRMISNRQHSKLEQIHKNYLVTDVVVDTVCNAACPICSENLSSTIARMKKIPINPFNGLNVLNTIDKDRIVQLDILGGEPGASRRSKQLLKDLSHFKNLQTIHISTNGSMIIPEIENLLGRGIAVDLVISMDGTESVFEYCRFPIKWDKFMKSVEHYNAFRKLYSKLSILLWSSISSLCIGDLDNMIAFANNFDIPINGAPIQYPEILSISKNNFLTSQALEKIHLSSNEFAVKLKPLICTDMTNSQDELISFLSNNDKIRNTDFRNIFNL